jgi:antirestriction protein
MSGPGEHAPGYEEMPQAVPRIYVASLSDYNAGILHGAWLDANQEADVLHEGITEMLAASPTTLRYGDVAEEWAIHDYENFGDVRLGEWESIERVATIGRGIVKHGDAFAAWIGNSDHEDITTEAFEAHFLGEWASETDWGESLLDDFGLDFEALPDVPEGLRPYVRVDVEGWVRDMCLSGDVDIVESRGGVYVFWT